MDFKSLEDVGTYMLINIRLSRYDLQFVNNLTNLIGVKNTITTNQDSLFRKIALKYKRQFIQNKYDINDLLELPWKCNTIESSPQYTNASIAIIDDKIIFKSPFNKNFLSALKKKPIYSMEWQKDKRLYEIKYGPTTLKDLITLSSDYFSVIDYCSITRKIIDSLSEYESVKYWEPTLVYSNESFYIASCNQVLYETIKDIPQTNDLAMVATYVYYGIVVDESVIEHFNQFENPLKVNLAVNFQSDFEIKHLDVAIRWLHEWGCDSIIDYARSHSPKQLFLSNENLEYLFDELDIDLVKDHDRLKAYDKPVMIHYRNYGYMETPISPFKVIKCVNSEPVNLGT